MADIPIRIALNGAFKDNPDKDAIRRIVAAIRAQKDLITYKPCRMIIQIPDMHVIFHRVNGRDLFIFVMKMSKELTISIKQLDKYEDVPWKFADEADVPEDMLARLKRNSGM